MGLNRPSREIYAGTKWEGNWRSSFVVVSFNSIHHCYYLLYNLFYFLQLDSQFSMYSYQFLYSFPIFLTSQNFIFPFHYYISIQVLLNIWVFEIEKIAWKRKKQILRRILSTFSLPLLSILLYSMNIFIFIPPWFFHCVMSNYYLSSFLEYLSSFYEIIFIFPLIGFFLFITSYFKCSHFPCYVGIIRKWE